MRKLLPLPRARQIETSLSDRQPDLQTKSTIIPSTSCPPALLLKQGEALPTRSLTKQDHGTSLTGEYLFLGQSCFSCFWLPASSCGSCSARKPVLNHKHDTICIALIICVLCLAHNSTTNGNCAYILDSAPTS